MPKKYLLVILLWFLSTAAHSQDENSFHGIFDTYFHHNPLDKPFSEFLLGIKNDPGIAITEFTKRSDKRLFTLSGIFSGNVPELKAVVPDSVEIFLTELPVLLSDSLKLFDTIFIYQVVFSASSEKESENNFIWEYKKFIRKYKGLFNSVIHRKPQSKGLGNGEAAEFMDESSPLPSLTVFWGTVPVEKKLFFTVSLYIKQSENRANIYSPWGVRNIEDISQFLNSVSL